MDVGLYDLLRTCNNTDTKEIGGYSHVTTYGPKDKWSILDNSYEKFWKTYCEIAETPEKNKKKICLAEIPRKHMPIIADLTLKFHPLSKDATTEDPYEEDFILAIVYCYQQVIKETMKISESGAELICCVLKAEPVMEDNLIVCRIRLQFPYCKTLGQIQNRVIRPILLQMVRSINVFSRLASQPVNDWEDIVDPLSVEKPIFMYGSSMSPTTPKLVLEYIFPAVRQEEIDECKTSVMETSETFFFENHEHMTGGIVTRELFKDEYDEATQSSSDFWLPYFLSIYYLKEITLTKNVNPTSLATLKTSNKKVSAFSLKSSNSLVSFESEDGDSNEHLSTVFLSMLERKRAEEEHYWTDIGKALHSCYNGSERGLEKWINFSESSDVHTAEDCKSSYYNLLDNKITIKTLAFYAREDNPNEYKKWHESWYLKPLEKALSCTHSDVAEAIYRVYWLDFGCSNLGKGTMYCFRNHIWKLLDAGHLLKTIISGDFLEIIERFRTNLAMQIQESDDQNYKDNAEIMIQKTCKLIIKLKNRPFKSAIFSEAAEKFYIEEFEDKLDISPFLMGCVNGVIETLDTKAVFRDGKPEDYVSRTTGVFWRHDMNEKHHLYVKLLNWLVRVFPDKELLNHFGKLMGASLRGRNADKIFPIHTGSGNNSKSMIKKLIEAAFGNFIITLNTATFTSARNTNADPSLARSKFAHLAFIQEPDAETPLKSGIIKEMTGGDKFFARYLHSNGSEVEPMFTLHMQCNTVPIIPQCDAAIKARVRIIPYLSRWSMQAPKSIDEQFKERHFLMDPFFEKQIAEMAPAFLFYCVKMYGVYRREGLRDPDIVIKHTNAYWEENDIYGQFIKENIEKAYKQVSGEWKGEKPLDDTAFISLADLYIRFKVWHKENFGNLRTPDRQILRGEMEVRVTKSRNRNYYGIKFKGPIVMDI